MEVKLVVIKGSSKTREVCLRNPETIIGRQAGCGLRIPSAMVSRRHCRLRVQGGRVTLEDLKSANGSFINGVRVYGTEDIKPGDRVEIGPVTFQVEYQRMEPPVLAAPPPPLPAALPEAIPLLDSDFVAAIPLDDGPQRPTVMTPDTAHAGEDDMPLEFDNEEGWRLPEGQDLRDILSQAEES